MNDDGVPRQYMVGDRIVVELDLEHRTNLGRVFVAFTHETDPLTELYFEATSFPEERRVGATRTSRLVLEAAVTSEVVTGVYALNRVNVFSVGGKLARLQEDALSGISERSFEVIEEPAETPIISGLRFLG
ncbi:MAG: hypothetical protein ACR2JR_16150 [Rubrobacteraceae bacterium]